MRFRDVVYQNILIILFGLSIFYLDDTEFKDSNIILLIFVFALIKSFYFVYAGFKKIIWFSKNNISYHNFLLFLSLNIALIVLSFATDYLCLFQMDPNSFSGVSLSLNWYEKTFKFFYFSVLIFSNIGIANIIPQTMASEFLMMLEAILSFVTIIFILSDFISLKDSLNSYLETKNTQASKKQEKEKV